MTRRLWYVLPLDIESDPNQPIVHQVGAQPVEVAGGFDFQAAIQAPRREGQRRNAQPAAPQIQGGMVFKINASSKKEFTEACTTREAANERAEQLAGKFPKRPFGIFECVSVVETMEAPIIKKEFNDAGELRVASNPVEEENHAV